MVPRAAALFDRQRQSYPPRVAVAEPVLANIRTRKRRERFTRRGKINVTIQWFL